MLFGPPHDRFGPSNKAVNERKEFLFEVVGSFRHAGMCSHVFERLGSISKFVGFWRHRLSGKKNKLDEKQHLQRFK